MIKYLKSRQVVINKIDHRILQYILLSLLLLLGVFNVISLRQPWGRLPENN